MKKVLSVLLAALLVLSIASVSLADDKPVITYYAYWCGALDEGSYCETYVEDKLGIDVKISKVAHTDEEAVNLMIATEMPECGWFTKSFEYMEDEELIRRIPRAMVEEYAPSLIEYMNEYPILYALCLDPEDDTQFRFLPDMSDTYTQMYLYPIYLRYDWIKALGIDLGVEVEQTADRLYVSDKGISLDVFTEIMTKFVKEDPDGNGVADTQGLISNYDRILSAFGLIDGNMELDGKVTMWYTHPAVKDWLTYLQGAYADGLVLPEIFTISGAEVWELINNGVSGIYTGGSTNALNAWAANRPPLTILDDPESTAELLMIPGVADANGVTMKADYLSAMGGEKFYIRWDVEDDHLVDILKFYEWCNWCDGDDKASLWYGEQGVNWEWNEDKSMPLVLENCVAGDRGAQVFCRNNQVGDVWRWITFEPYFAAGSKYYIKNDGGLWNEGLVQQYKNDIYNETEAGNINNEYSADWGNTRNAYFMAVIMGEKNVEEDWDAYIKELNDLHYGEYLDELDKAATIADVIASFAK